ncbi:hypothetical protein Zmor_008528 [Zophobas morio]|uniref:Uncharacterized protein n=1 Tax=Zophobas morio TaxID=2755281 RepID=A0AA38J014_9CUCU|nr:hypothetical protein Zmor_008528 [Zophobas morio]
MSAMNRVRAIACEAPKTVPKGPKPGVNIELAIRFVNANSSQKIQFALSFFAVDFPTRISLISPSQLPSPTLRIPPLIIISSVELRWLSTPIPFEQTLIRNAFTARSTAAIKY